ncbi:MAG: 50S ribosomal protein L13, large subunit ribosomal protein L13 [Candidatus Peregrinibacteria bacterium GW2011_GWF2_43_17]|nr:MAG: 50S ribosomal protein L13, large subunit ribosomal protein L13 [Candidatus Peregrinibacteria bacterium GW2011_GWF2_43_17]KKT19757.1 MAG: 50S ribosomal protein L13 [Candidatus Peregrinibacteria bacterium GW2011_GWA2_43_8]HAU40206.1 50S ribosomal protein L13 [Candidatus Peregrinibacteria bacterium]
MKKKTYSPKLPEMNKARKWYLVDAEDRILGDLASKIAVILRGKNKPVFSPHIDCGDYVVVINAGKIKLSGNKLDKKTYFKHTGYMGHFKVTTAREMLETKPEKVLTDAVTGMVPNNRLRKHVMDKLMVYAGKEHKHSAQNPESLKI